MSTFLWLALPIVGYRVEYMQDKKTELGEIAGKIAEENREGMQKLADEELSENRRNEFFVQKYVRKAKRFLGLESSDATVIDLN